MSTATAEWRDYLALGAASWADNMAAFECAANVEIGGLYKESAASNARELLEHAENAREGPLRGQIASLKIDYTRANAKEAERDLDLRIALVHEVQ